MWRSDTFIEHPLRLDMVKQEDETYVVTVTNIGDFTMYFRLDGIALQAHTKQDLPYSPGQTRIFTLPRLRRMIVDVRPMPLDQLIVPC